VEVDAARKRIALSIKQTLEAPSKNSRIKGNFKKKEEDLSSMNVNDALAALKKKFGK
jgi:protein Tex